MIICGTAVIALNQLLTDIGPGEDYRDDVNQLKPL